jgi:hypothetical protein
MPIIAHRRRARSHHPSARVRPARATVEPIERRLLFDGLATTTAIRSGGSWAQLPASPAVAGAATAPFTPAQVRHFYGVDATKVGSTALDGTGQTIAIIDAYSSATITTDIATFDANFGLPACNLQVVNEQGAPSPLPAVKSDWASEITLDVEWAHAIAPGAKILLVECSTNYDSDLFAGAAMAGRTAGVSVVSMSFSGGDYTDATDDATFADANVTFLAATGDSGGEVGYPATSANVVAVGGTSITTADASGSYGGESAWSDGGGGTSQAIARPAYQASVDGTAYRDIPDVSAIADPNTGVTTYEAGSYYQYGGTSLATPVWAGMIALANQGRALTGQSALTGATQTLPMLYQLPASDFHDVTTGNNTHPATAGYDLATGLGTLVANLLVPGLIGQTSAVVTSVTAGDGSTYALHADGTLTRTTTSGGSTLIDTGVSAIAAVADGSVYDLEGTTHGKLLKWTNGASTVAAAETTGTTIGTAGSYANAGNTIAKATDGNLTTFFDGPTANSNWVGLDLGASYTINALAYTSRSGWAARMNGGVFQASNSATFASPVTLYTVGASANPSSTMLTLQATTATGAYRYVRYLSPANSYGNVAEIEFFGNAAVTPIQLTGTTIGTAGSYLNAGNTIAKATDGSLTTFFDGPVANGNWVGLDLGTTKSISQIAFAPRSGWASRMVGGQFQVSTTADFSSGVTTVYTIGAAPTVGSLTTVTLATPVTARYVRYLSPAGSYGNIAEFQVFG